MPGTQVAQLDANSRTAIRSGSAISLAATSTRALSEGVDVVIQRRQQVQHKRPHPIVPSGTKSSTLSIDMSMGNVHAHRGDAGRRCSYGLDDMIAAVLER